MSLACNLLWRWRPAGVFAMCPDLKNRRRSYKQRHRVSFSFSPDLRKSDELNASPRRASKLNTRRVQWSGGFANEGCFCPGHD